MNEIDVSNNIGCCGKICKLCSKADDCDGCREKKARNARKNSPEGCYPYFCCRRKGIEGCWECSEGPCDKDVFASKQGITLRAFVMCAKEEGTLALGTYVFQNDIHGIRYEAKHTYMACSDEEAVLKLLHSAKLVRTKG